jgi:hypothetical protein
MHIFVPSDRTKIVFNVDEHVGPNCPNATEDVFLVQFLMRKAVAKALADRPLLRQRILRVQVTGKCDPATVDGIKAVQERMKEKNPGTIIDGRVSPAKGTIYGDGTWTILTLNATVRGSYPETWPRLQDFQDCPAPLKQRVPSIL